MQEYRVEVEAAPQVFETIQVPEGTRLMELADRYQDNYPNAIVLAAVDRKLRELNKLIQKKSRNR